ncbi:MAG TPA: c-type cytochrome [Chitinophagaceae bacterium]
MKTKFLIIAAVAISLAFAGCYYDKSELVYPAQTACDTANLKYSTDITGILATNCYACHSGSAQAGGSVKLDSYTALTTVVNNGKLVLAITHSPGASAMPKNMPKLSDCDINRIKAWINQGAQNN